MSLLALLAIAFAVLAVLALASWLRAFLDSATRHWGAVDGIEDMEFEDSTGLPESPLDAARQWAPHPSPMQWKPKASEFAAMKADFRWLGNFAERRPNAAPGKARRAALDR
jgi:hypothetical protein